MKKINTIRREKMAKQAKEVAAKKAALKEADLSKLG